MKLKGATIKKIAGAGPAGGAAEVAALQATNASPHSAEFTLVDRSGVAVANQRFRIEFSDGSVKRGTTGADGKAKAPAPGRGRYKLILEGVAPGRARVR